MLKILVVDDDTNISELISLYLNKEGYETKEVANGKTALEVFGEYKPDLVLLDVMLPGADGYDVCKEIRKKSRTPIIMLTAKGEVFDKVLGLELGADDYMVKPFSVRELTARVKAQLRRYVDYNKSDKKQKNILKHKNLMMDVTNYKVFKDNCEIALRPKEFEILKLLMSNPERVFTKEQIFEYVWKDNYVSDDNTVMVHIKRLRNKIEDSSDNPKYVITVWGIGYKLGE